METEKVYHDAAGNERNIHQMIHSEPEWAANRIQEGEKAIANNESLKQGIKNIVDKLNGKLTGEVLNALFALLTSSHSDKAPESCPECGGKRISGIRHNLNCPTAKRFSTDKSPSHNDKGAPMAKMIIVGNCKECTKKKYSVTLAAANWYCTEKYIKLGTHPLEDRVHPDCPLLDAYSDKGGYAELIKNFEAEYSGMTRESLRTYKNFKKFIKEKKEEHKNK